ncbi:hypothetical protein [Streptomyces phaeofaciens]
MTLIIATFLLLIGIVGRGVSAGSSQFHITLEGSIGRLPRVAILAVSIATYILAIFGFIHVANSNSSSEKPPAAVASAEASASVITVAVGSTLAEGATSEHDVITLDLGLAVVLDMDTGSPKGSGYFELGEEYSGMEVDYSIEITITDSNGEESRYTGEGEIVLEDGLTYTAYLDEEGVASLQ